MSQHYQKRGGDAARVTLDEVRVVASAPDQDVVAIDKAVDRARGGRCAKESGCGMRFFGGLTLQETTEALQVSRDTVKRDWKTAKLWLLRDLRGGTHDVI